MATKLTEQEIEAIKGFQQKTQNVIMDLGKIELQMNDLLSVKEKVKEAMAEVVKEQNEFFQTIESSYGKGQINLDTFEFIPAEAPANETPVVPFTQAEVL
jgi:transcription-repair coupling factor (superfamily II helicase)